MGAAGPCLPDWRHHLQVDFNAFQEAGDGQCFRELPFSGLPDKLLQIVL